MKLQVLQTIIQEQGPNDSSLDPFAPLPYESDDGDQEMAKLKSRKAAIMSRIQAIDTKSRLYMRSLAHYGQYKHVDNYHRNAPHLKNPASLPAGELAWGVNTYDPAELHPDHAKFRQKYGPEYNKLVLADIHLQKSIETLKRKRKKEKEAANIAALANSTAATAPSSTLAPSQIPSHIRISSTGKGILNPYVNDTDAKTRYAGPPSGYSFTSQMKTLYAAIEVALRRHGKTLATIYAGRPYVHTTGWTGINFVATTTDGKFIWRKYDPGSGAGQNYIYLNGKAVKTSWFVRLTPQQQDTELKAAGVI